MIEQEPRIRWLDAVAGGCIYLGFLLFLVVLHILTINSTGDTSTVMNGVFTAFIGVFIAITIFSMIGIVVHFMKWITWTVSMPAWKKDMSRKKE